MAASLFFLYLDGNKKSQRNKMAITALTILGSVISATAFIVGSYLAKYLSDGSDSDKEKKRHDLAV